jgi:GNAT superfamily N-acetyltransferase
MSVRKIETRDIRPLIELGRLMHQEGEYRFLPFEESKCVALLERCLKQPDSWCALVAEDGSEIAGMLIGYKSSYMFCSETVASDLALYVRPGRRGGFAAAALIRRFSAWARASGAREACLSTSLNVRNERTAAFIERLGFRCVGGVFKRSFDGPPGFAEPPRC